MMRDVLRSGTLAGVVALQAMAMMAGCLSTRPDDSPAPPQVAEPADAPRYVGVCDNLLLFQFVDNSVTDHYLPPGFHPRDPRGFITVSPIAFGQAAVLLIALACDGEDGRYSAGSLAIFVESPSVPGLDPAPFNFYEVERYAAAGQFDGVLDRAGWPRIDGTVEITVGGSTDQARSGLVYVNDTVGQAAFFGGSMDAPIELTGTMVRFWNDQPAGLAYIEYEAVLDSLAGPGACTVRAGTTLANITTSGPLAPLASLGIIGCPPGEPIVSTFPDMSVNATARFLPGVHAE